MSKLILLILISFIFSGYANVRIDRKIAKKLFLEIVLFRYVTYMKKVFLILIAFSLTSYGDVISSFELSASGTYNGNKPGMLMPNVLLDLNNLSEPYMPGDSFLMKATHLPCQEQLLLQARRIFLIVLLLIVMEITIHLLWFYLH